MNKLSALALGTALSLSMPLAALAQDSDAGVTLDGGVSTELGGEDNGVDADVDAGVDAQTDAGVDADAEAGVEADALNDASAEAETGMSAYTYGDLDAALQGAGSADLSGVTAETEIEIVSISTLGDDGEFTADAFAGAQADYEGDISALQGNIADNIDLVTELEANGYTAEDVVGVWSQADGSLTVFVDDGAAADAGADAEAGAAIDGELDAGGTNAGTEVDTDADADAEVDADAGADADADAAVEGETTTQ